MRSSAIPKEINWSSMPAPATSSIRRTRVYQALVKKEAADLTFVGKLPLAQKAWVAFRDAELEARFVYADGDERVCWGSMYPMLCLSRKTELTRDRTRQLQQILKDGRGD